MGDATIGKSELSPPSTIADPQGYEIEYHRWVSNVEATRASTVIDQLRWYLGRQDVRVDAERVAAGGALAIVGGAWDDVAGFADRIAPERPVLDLRCRTPTAREVRELFAAHPEAIVLAPRAERVIAAIGLETQPWYLQVAPLTARPAQAMTLLRQAIAQLGVVRTLDELSVEAMAGLSAYHWPRGLKELREASWRIGAILDGGNMSAGARRLDVSRQALTKYLVRRLT